MVRHGVLVLGFAALLASSVACSSSSDGATPDAGNPTSDAATDVSPDASSSVCDPPPKASRCGNEGAWVRGVARFDPSHFAPGAKPQLRVTLRHKFVLVPGEENIGGRLHGYASVKTVDPTKGSVAFAIDMCALGTAMWSEENGTFNLILSLDENNNNNLAYATSNEDAITIATIDPGELTKMVDVDVSCNAASACLDVKLDCKDGAKCTTITPMASCTKKTPGCPSDDVFCN
jgi:hypothetical protein